MMTGSARRECYDAQHNSSDHPDSCTDRCNSHLALFSRLGVWAVGNSGHNCRHPHHFRLYCARLDEWLQHSVLDWAPLTDSLQHSDFCAGLRRFVNHVPARSAYHEEMSTWLQRLPRPHWALRRLPSTCLPRMAAPIPLRTLPAKTAPSLSSSAIIVPM